MYVNKCKYKVSKNPSMLVCQYKVCKYASMHLRMYDKMGCARVKLQLTIMDMMGDLTILHSTVIGGPPWGWCSTISFGQWVSVLMMHEGVWPSLGWWVTNLWKVGDPHGDGV